MTIQERVREVLAEYIAESYDIGEMLKDAIEAKIEHLECSISIKDEIDMALRRMLDDEVNIDQELDAAIEATIEAELY